MNNDKLNELLSNVKNTSATNMYNINAFNSFDNPSMYYNYNQKQFDDVAKRISMKREETEKREIRNLEINEEKLELTKLTNFLLQSVNKDQKQMLEQIESLICTISINDKVKEANLAIIQQELLDLKNSTDNLNDSFIKLIEKKMLEMGVEVGIKYLFIGIRELFLIP